MKGELYDRKARHEARIRSLREQSVTTQAHIDMERAKYFTETYRQYEGTVSIPELRALALKNYFSKKPYT